MTRTDHLFVRMVARTPGTFSSSTSPQVRQKMIASGRDIGTVTLIALSPALTVQSVTLPTDKSAAADSIALQIK